jgi:hypothetical protein
MLISILIPVIYYRISTSCQFLHLSVVYVISVIFLNHQKFGVHNVKKVVILFCLILLITSIISLIKCSMSVNIFDVFTFFIISSMIATFLQSLWFSRLQILQHGRSCSLQYKLNFSWCSLQCSLISNTYNGNFWYWQNRKTNSSGVKEQKRLIENEIQELRTKINTHLDRLQENLMKELLHG